MKVIKYSFMDIANGPGIRITIWCSGCSHNCRGCHNPETHKYDRGYALTKTDVALIEEELQKPYVRGVTFSGGDPLFPLNREGVYALCKEFKEKFPSKDIWLWTGYNYENIPKKYLEYVDVLVDGKYIEELRSPQLPYTGSSNQRVIYIKEQKNAN